MPMDSLNLLSLAYFVIATTFTPGPNNLIAASLSIQNGLRRTMPTVYGVATGFFILMVGGGSHHFRIRVDVVVGILRIIV